MRLILPLLLALTIAAPAFAWQRPDDKLFAAIAEVESGGNPKARNASEDAVGIVQIRPIVVEDVNRILGTERYRLSDRYSVERSREMFDVYLTHYGDAARRRGKTVNYETLARIWNGGPKGYEKASTERYWYKVKRAMEGQ